MLYNGYVELIFQYLNLENKIKLLESGIICVAYAIDELKKLNKKKLYTLTYVNMYHDGFSCCLGLFNTKESAILQILHELVVHAILNQDIYWIDKNNIESLEQLKETLHKENGIRYSDGQHDLYIIEEFNYTIN
jgi:hypothetical protein